MNDVCEIIITAYRIDSLDTSRLSEFIIRLQNMLEGIPAEYRDSAVVEISSESDWDTHYPVLEIYYKRPELPEERIERLKIQKAKQDLEERKERALYERLRSKYEG